MHDEAGPFPWPDLAWSGALFLAAFGWFSITAPIGLELRDEGHLYTLASRAAAGEMPHRDFADVYGPAVYWVTGGVLAMADGQILAVRYALAAWKAMAVAATFLIGRWAAGTPIALAASLLAIALWGRPLWKLNAPYASLYTIPLALVAVLLLVHALRRRSAAGLFAAGVVAGASVLFKQSVGLLVVHGLGLVVLAFALLEPRGTGGEARRPSMLLSLWGLGALAVVVPFWPYLDAREYAIHLLPFHAWAAAIAVAGWRYGGAVDAAEVVWRRLAPLAAGALLAPGIVVLVYLASGGLGALVHDLFVLPTRMQDYAVRVVLPRPGSLAWVVGLALATFAALLALSGRRRAAGACAALAALAMALGVASGQALVGAFDAMAGVLPTVLVALAFAACAPLLVRGSAAGDRSSVLRLVALALFTGSLVAQILPRAGFKVLLLQPALVPLLVAVLGAAVRVAGLSGERRRAWLPVAIVAPLLIVAGGPSVGAVFGVATGSVPTRTLPFEPVRGVRISEFEYALRGMGDLEALVSYLREARPSEAPIFVLSNQAMIGHLSGRPALFADRQLGLSFVGWGRLGAEELAALDEPGMLSRLRATPEALVIDRVADEADGTPARYRRSLPRVVAFIDEAYAPVARFGVYTVLGRRR